MRGPSLWFTMRKRRLLQVLDLPSGCLRKIPPIHKKTEPSVTGRAKAKPHLQSHSIHPCYSALSPDGHAAQQPLRALDFSVEKTLCGRRSQTRGDGSRKRGG